MSNIDYSAIVTAEEKSHTHRKSLLAFLAEQRRSAERAGVVWRHGLTLKSDPASRAALGQLLSEWDSAVTKGGVIWKCADGWDRMDKRAVRKALRILRSHVQACFTAEHFVAQEITGNRLTSCLSIQERFQAILGREASP